MRKQGNPRKEKSTVQTNMVMLTIVTSVIILTVNIVLFTYISRAIDVINKVYSTNVTIGEMSRALSLVRNSMTDYLNTKSTDSMEQYYDACQQYRDYLSEIGLEGQERSFRYVSFGCGRDYTGKEGTSRRKV